MTTPKLYPQVDASFYTVSPSFEFKHHDERVTVTEFDVETCPHTNTFSVNVNGGAIRFPSAHRSHWPRVIRDLYWDHVKRTRHV